LLSLPRGEYNWKLIFHIPTNNAESETKRKPDVIVFCFSRSADKFNNFWVNASTLVQFNFMEYKNLIKIQTLLTPSEGI
jgi:hypothetical protein